MTSSRIGVVAAAALLVACRAQPEPQTYTMDGVPDELADAVAAMDSAVQTMQGRLVRRLMSELNDGGPVAAVRVCRDEAPAITAQVEAETGIELGRTSHRLRNPANAPRDWVRPHVETAAGTPAADVEPVVVDLGGRVGMLRPIPTARFCLQCHGPADALVPEVRAALGESYPEDRAVGFAEGDLRGFIWAEVGKGG
jgi:hypothetical protein